MTRPRRLVRRHRRRWRGCAVVPRLRSTCSARRLAWWPRRRHAHAAPGVVGSRRHINGAVGQNARLAGVATLPWACLARQLAQPCRPLARRPFCRLCRPHSRAREARLAVADRLVRRRGVWAGWLVRVPAAAAPVVLIAAGLPLCRDCEASLRRVSPAVMASSRSGPTSRCSATVQHVKWVIESRTFCVLRSPHSQLECQQG